MKRFSSSNLRRLCLGSIIVFLVVACLQQPPSRVANNHKATRGLQQDDAVTPAIITVIDSRTSLVELCWTLQTLERIKGYPDAPILIFHAIPLTFEKLSKCILSDTRSIDYIDITDLYNIPIPTTIPGFNPSAFSPDYFLYSQLQRFLITQLWQHSAIEPYNLLMRVSDTTCFTMDNNDLPGFASDAGETVQYQSQSIPGEYTSTKWTVGLWDEVFIFLSTGGYSPLNPALWSTAVQAHEGRNALPVFRDDLLEVVSVDFMKSSNVTDFHQYLTQNQRNFFERRWSSGTTRYLTMAIFGQYWEIDTRFTPGLMEKDLYATNLFPKICRLDPTRNDFAIE